MENDYLQGAYASFLLGCLSCVATGDPIFPPLTSDMEMKLPKAMRMQDCCFSSGSAAS